MALLAARGIAKSFGSRLILDGLDFDVEAGVRMGVIGPNGGGKSTLLRILAGDEFADAGEVTQRRGLIVSYLPQQLEGDARNAFATLRAARPDLDELERELETVEDGIGAAGAGSSSPRSAPQIRRSRADDRRDGDRRTATIAVATGITTNPAAAALRIAAAMT